MDGGERTIVYSIVRRRAMPEYEGMRGRHKGYGTMGIVADYNTDRHVERWGNGFGINSRASIILETL